MSRPQWACPPPTASCWAAPPGFVPGRPDPVEVIGRGWEQAVGVGAVWAGGAALDVAAEYHVIEMRRDGVGDEELAEAIIVHAPGIGGAFHDRFEDVFDGVVAPDAAVIEDFFTGGGDADGAVGSSAVAAVEPAVGSPDASVDDVVGGLVAEAVEKNLWVAVGLVVVVLVGNEEQMRR